MKKFILYIKESFFLIKFCGKNIISEKIPFLYSETILHYSIGVKFDSNTKKVYDISGAISGALNPESKQAEEHAKQMYEQIRQRKTDCQQIAKNTEFSIEEIKRIKNYL